MDRSREHAPALPERFVRQRRDCVMVPAPNTDSASPPIAASPPSRPVAAPGPSGLTDGERIRRARIHLLTALRQVAPGDDEIIVEHMQAAYDILTGQVRS